VSGLLVGRRSNEVSTSATPPQDYEGPVARLPGDVRTNSRVFGLPVVTDDGYTHAPECYWCDGTANSDTCPRSVHLNAYFEKFPAGDAEQPAAPAAPAGGVR
jgi:hypothetical protein